MNRQDDTVALDVLAKAVIDAAIEVHRQLGPGFLESIYEEALAVELTTRQIPFERQKPLTVMYKDRAMGEGRIDLVEGGELLVELKPGLFPAMDSEER